jgi:hypothetical protein
LGETDNALPHRDRECPRGPQEPTALSLTAQ